MNPHLTRRPRKHRQHIAVPVIIVGVMLLSLSFLTACQASKSAAVAGEQELGTPGGKPAAIYVADFELWTEDIKQEEAALAARPGPVGRVGKLLSGTPTDPDSRARELIHLMAESLVRDLSRAGLKALRLPQGGSLPSQGWLVRGSFMQVQEGNRLQRSIVGFGHGETEVQVVANLDDLTQGTPRPLYEVVTDATSGRKPGAGATLAFSPWGAVVHYVRGGTDVEKNIQQTASQIAAQITRHVHQTNRPPASSSSGPSRPAAG